MAAARLSFLDRWLTLWIALAMGLGLLVGRFVPGLVQALADLSIGSTSVPIAVGLIAMMIPPFARVKPSELPKVFADPKALGMSVLLNWVVGPVLMFALAWLFLSDSPELFAGLVLVGLARCIAMVVVWNQLAGGSAEDAAGLVAFNSLFQVFTYGAYAWFFLSVVSPAVGMPAQTISVSMGQVASSVALYLGLPFALGIAIRWGIARKAGEAVVAKFNAKFAPVTLVALLFTIVVLFSLQGHRILAEPFQVVRVAIPLAIYFAVMFSTAWFFSRRLGMDYGRTVTQAFTSASNNFELAIAVAIGSFGLTSGAAFAATIGPLVEVPVMVALVQVAARLKLRNR
ncbi:MAG: ACR3 family arsenite efflux transporter [Fibrobacterota bacterium]|nr:ACR3 family arsenite efflux transporter [Fibrobacterota bacterium]QQS07692.1 MAG: ACR3 family arsenite efflux transporter [Fibrobacterota bacterium]